MQARGAVASGWDRSSGMRARLSQGSALRIWLLALTALISTWAFGASTSQAGTLGNALFHHGFHVDEPNGPEDAQGDEFSGKMGADTIRMHVYWEHYQTGHETYSTGWLEGIVARVEKAREASGNGSIKALITFELPTSRLAWMETAGYGLVNQQQLVSEKKSTAPATGVARYYPTTAKGLQAYGLAAAKALKYLYEAGVAEYLETPNEPNLIDGPSEVVNAAKIGQLGGWAVSEAYKLGLPQHSFSGGPAFLIGDVSADASAEKNYEFSTPTLYFQTVQYYADLTIDQQFPESPETAGGLKQQWRPSFHAYPNNGKPEKTFCEYVTSSPERTQDQLGDTTATAALSTVTSKLTPLVNSIGNGKHWWLTETGMSSYKTNKTNYETSTECYGRREGGGSTYGKTQQSEFVANLVGSANSQIVGKSGVWSKLEGLTYFRARDIQVGQFAGYGFYCGTFPACYQTPKPAATTFLQRYGSPVWYLGTLGEPKAISDPDASSWGQYRLDFFVRNSEDKLRHKAYAGTGWTEWKTIGGGPELLSGPGAVSWGSNRIDVVAKAPKKAEPGKTTIGHWATGDGGKNWAYDELGEENATSDPDASSWGSGRLDFFVRGKNGELRHKYYDGAWSSWKTVPVGPALDSGPAAVSWGTNRIDVVARIEGGSVGHWATADGGKNWAYDNLGGNIVGAPDASTRGAYTLHFFGRSPGNQLVTKTYNGLWSGWETVPIGPLYSGPGAVSWNSERTDVVGLVSDPEEEAKPEEEGGIVHWAGTP